MADNYQFGGYKCDKNAQSSQKNGIQRVIQQNEQFDSIFTGRSLQKCPDCGAVLKQRSINYLGCDCCGKEVKSDLRKIRDALETYGNLPAFQLARIAGVPRDVVSAYLADGALTVGESGAKGPLCGICGSKMINGTVCPKCNRAFKEEFGNRTIREGQLAQKPQWETEKHSCRMHYLDRHK